MLSIYTGLPYIESFMVMFMEYKPRVLFIHGSPRKYGSSTQLAKIAAKGVFDANGIVEEIFLYDYTIKECIGCVSEDSRYCRFPCIIRDDNFNEIGYKVLESDGLVFVTPVYWYAPSGILKNFIDRLTSMENMIFHESRRSLLEGKVAGFIATGLDSGVYMAITYMMSVLNSMGVIIAPWSMAYSHSEDIVMDEGALRDAYNVGYLVAETIKAIKVYGKHIGYKPDVKLDELVNIVVNHREANRIEKQRRISEIENHIREKSLFTKTAPKSI